MVGGTDPLPGGGGDFPAGAPAAGTSAGHRWCLSAKGKIINSPRAEMMWAVSPNDAWLLTNHGMAIEGVPPPNSLPGTPPPIIGVGLWPTLIHWDGRSFCAIDHTFLNQRLGVRGAIWSLWGSGPNDVWGVGELGGAIRWNGQSWQRITVGAQSTSDELTAVAGTGPNDVYVVADGGGGGYGQRGGDLLHWNGATWRPVRPDGHPINFYKYSRMWVDEDGDMWLTWIDDSTNGPPGCELMLIQQGAASCELTREFGSGWSKVEGVHGHAIQPWVVVRDIRKDNASVWTIADGKWRSFAFPEKLHAIRARSNIDVWVAAVGGIWRWDGSHWHEPDPTTAGITGLWTSDAGDVWGWGEKGIYLWTGQSWRRLSG